MKNPYKILGISPTASNEEVKAAYDKEAAEYSTPTGTLEKQAVEHMQELRKAYQTIVQMRFESSQTYAIHSSHSDIRRLVQKNCMNEAEELLDGVPGCARDAEWYFLKGSVLHARGWLDDAYEHFSVAGEKDPADPEYMAALSLLKYEQRTGQVTYETKPTAPNKINTKKHTFRFWNFWRKDK